MPVLGPFSIFFIFLGLKLSQTTDWSWWWVTSPLWIGAILLGFIVTIGLLFVNHARKRMQAHSVPFKSWEHFV